VRFLLVAPDYVATEKLKSCEIRWLISQALSSLHKTRQARQITAKLLNCNGKSLLGDTNFPTKNPTNAIRNPTKRSKLVPSARLTESVGPKEHRSNDRRRKAQANNPIC
jgi:hypothetical protein